MRSALIGLLLLFQAATSFALDTLAENRLRLNIPWFTSIIGASENPDGLTTTIIGQNGYTWTHPHGTLNTIIHPAFVNDTLEEAVAVQRRFIFASSGSTLIKYEWPGMKEIERHNLSSRVSLINLWTQDRIAVLAGDTVWSFYVDQPMFNGTVLSTDSIATISSHDSTLYMATSEGRIYRARGDTLEILVETGRKISHIAASSAFIAMNHPEGSNAALYSLQNGQIIGMSLASGGRLISMCNSSTVILHGGRRFTIYTIDTTTGRSTTYSHHYYSEGWWSSEMRIFPISQQMFMLASMKDSMSMIMNSASGYNYVFSSSFWPLQLTTVVDDHSIAVCARGRSQEFSMGGDGNTSFENIFEFSVENGNAIRARRAPTSIKTAVELAHADSVYYLTTKNNFSYHTSSAGPGVMDMADFDDYRQVLSRGSKAWMIHWDSSRYRSTEVSFSSDGGKTWNTIGNPGFSSNNFYPSACQVGFNDRLYGPTYNWLNLQYFQASDKYLWFTEPVSSPENDVIPRYSLPTRDQAVMLILDKKSYDILPSRIWNLDYGNKTSKAQLFVVPDVGYARVVSAHVHNSVMMGLWEAIDTKDLGIFVTDGDRWGYYSIDSNSFAEGARSAILVPNDTTMVVFDATSKEFIVYHPKLPKPVGVADHHTFGDQSTDLQRLFSIDGRVRWQHGVHDATVTVFDVNGRQCGNNVAADMTCELQLPGRGLFIIQATGDGQVKRMLVSY